MAGECTPSVRSLFAWEVEEARRVFAEALAYSALRVHECVSWPNTMNRIGSFMKGIPYDPKPNAITLGNHLYFPVRLLESLVDVNDPEHQKIGWLIHELTHAWQYQHLGWKYLGLALEAQFRFGAKAYDFGGVEGLIAATQAGWHLGDFNLEQQGDLARLYYEFLSAGLDTSAFQPFIAELQGAV